MLRCRVPLVWLPAPTVATSRIAMFLAMILVALGLACRSNSPGSAVGVRPLLDADIRQIREREQAFVRAELARDVDASLELRTDDAVWMAPGMPAIEGKPAVRRMFESLPPTLEFALTPVRTEGSGDLAYNRGTFRHIMLAGTDTIGGAGKYVQIWRREAGTWRIAAEIFNSDS